jgi:hypothetical protein
MNSGAEFVLWVKLSPYAQAHTYRQLRSFVGSVYAHS